MTQTIASRYRIVHELGHGMMGTVYLVEHLHTGGQAALKVLRHFAGADADTIERFKREARAAASVSSEHVVKITDAGTAPELGGAPFLVMEVLQGTDLEKVIEARGPLPATEVAGLLGQLGRALDKAHALGIVHRDLKPANLFLHTREDGSTILKILDFGVSKTLASARPEPGQHPTALTWTGMMIGTPRYMPPEQARGQSAAMGPATDIWAVGMIAFRLLTSRDYWTSETVADLMAEILTGPMPPPSQRAPGLGPAFDAWFARSCNRDPRNRWASAGEQASTLAAALLGSAATGNLAVAPHSWPKLPYLGALLAITVLIAASASIAGMLHSCNPPPATLVTNEDRTHEVPPSSPATMQASPATTTSNMPMLAPTPAVSAGPSAQVTAVASASSTAKVYRPKPSATAYNPAAP